MPKAEELLFVYARRLDAYREGVIGPWPPSLANAVEGFVQKLKALGPEEIIELNLAHDTATFFLPQTGEILMQIERRKHTDVMPE